MTGRGFAARQAATGLIIGAAAIAVVTGLIAVLKQFVEPLGLISLYLFAIFPVSIGWGFWVAGIIAVTSYLAFAFFFASPLHSLRIADSDTAAALVVSLVTAYVVSELARRAHARAREARLLAQEAEDAQTELVASRARLVTAGDDARRRIVRDLHDGAQQRLVHTIVTLRLAQRTREGGDVEAAKELLAEALDNAEQANTELRELAHGILPTALTRGGLAPAVAALVSRARIPVGVDVPDERFAPEVEATAYFVIAEALTNIAKHSGAHEAQVRAWTEDGLLRVDVCDDGAGGARPDGSGLLGLHDRVVSLGGHLRIESPWGGGTRIAATLPLQC
jgi:signal transduction histidine kinase